MPMSQPEIRLVKNKDIDYRKWDQCINGSSIPLVYAQSWYLDLICPNWNALVLGDFAYVMPLNIKQKFGVTFLLQPIYAQQQGIFPEANLNIQNAFLSELYNRFKYVTINLSSSHSEPFPEGFSVQSRTNFILNLTFAYDELQKNYSQHTRRQIRKADDNKVFVIKGIQTGEYLELKKIATPGKLAPQSMQTLKRLLEYGSLHGNGTIYAAYNQQNELCAAAFFLYSGQRVTYLNAASNEEGKKVNAMHKIVDQFIQEHSGSSLTLDFEGSSIPGIARFYAGFGSEPEQYYCLKSNRLPIPLRWFKK
jgi:lipid II:glycine glycyltransferase (peptidoglycan interpeptide bridge formation enzyme)